MAEKPFRVLLDLTDLHIECFKYVWISVSPREVKTIAEFKQSLLQKINLGSENIKLFIRDGLLLDEETIIVLREDDTIKVQYEKEISTISDTPKSSTKIRSSRKRNFAEFCEKNTSLDQNSGYMPFTAQNEMYLEDGTHKRKKKHKKSHRLSHDENVCSNVENNTENLPGKHKKKSKEDTSLMTVNSLDSNSHDNYVSFPPLESCHDTIVNCKKNKKAIKDKTTDAVTFETNTKNSLLNELSFTKVDVKSDMEDQQNRSNSISGLSNNCPKKKRKRHRKRKNSNLINNELSIINANNESFSTEISTEFAKPKHMIFTSGSSEKAKEKPHTMNLNSNENCGIHNTYNMHIENVPTTDKKNQCVLYPKVSTPAQSAECANPNWQVSLMQNSSLDPPCDEVQSVKKQSVKNNKNSKNITEENLKKSSGQNSDRNENYKNLTYVEFPSLNAMPNVGAHIAYKILELNENYSPEVSEYREGIVKSIDSKSDEIEIELLKHEIKPGRTGKFENLKNDEVPPPEIIRTDIVSWSALIEPKLISHSC